MKKNFYKMFLVLSVVFLLLGCKKNDLQNIAEFMVTFNSNGGSEIESIKVEENKTLSKPTDPTKEELSFINWFKEKTLINIWDFEKDVVTQNITLYAKWTNYIRTIKFNSNGGSEIESIEVEDNKTLSKPTDPTNGELLFVNWFKDEALVNVWDFENDVVTQDTTLYAKWTNDTYTITFDTNGGSDLAPMKVIKGLAAIEPISPIKHEFALEGWFKEPSLTNLYDFSTIVDSDITLYAKWVEITIEKLRKLVSEAYEISWRDYTIETFYAMIDKMLAAEEVSRLQNPTSQQIIFAYAELSDAMNSLVASPRRPVVKIEVNYAIDDVVYFKAGELNRVFGSVYDITGSLFPTDNRVTLTCNIEELEAWAQSEIIISNGFLQIETKSTIPAGSTININFKSAENPNIYKNVKLKIPGEGEIKKLFIDAVNALPLPEKISYEDFEAIKKAGNLEQLLTPEEKESVKSESEKRSMCFDTYFYLPFQKKYSFKGNVCTLTRIFEGWMEKYLGEFNFVADGAFPAGTYTSNFFESRGSYLQYKRTFKSDGTGKIEYREGDDANGTNPTEWKTTSTFTYTNEGSQADGGMFYVDYNKK